MVSILLNEWYKPSMDLLTPFQMQPLSLYNVNKTIVRLSRNILILVFWVALALFRSIPRTPEIEY